jgi:hypothetical protein
MNKKSNNQQQIETDYKSRFNSLCTSADSVSRLKDTLTLVKLSPMSKGRQYAEKYAEGERLTTTQAIQAKCWDCCGGYADGRKDCECMQCPLYPLMPYGLLKKERYVRPDRRKTGEQGKGQAGSTTQNTNVSGNDTTDTAHAG